jgi:hypothetical protein
MWLLLPVALLPLAVLASAGLVRITRTGSGITFLGSGSVLGVVLIIVLLRAYGIGTRTLAGLALYAAACELYLILTSVARTSIGAQVLRLVAAGIDTPQEVAANLRENVMLGWRVDRLVADGLAQRAGELLIEATQRGRRVGLAMSAVRRFFGIPDDGDRGVTVKSAACRPSR